MTRHKVDPLAHAGREPMRRIIAKRWSTTPIRHGIPWTNVTNVRTFALLRSIQATGEAKVS
ncbi:MAG TPA: hypothetical protein VGC82_11565 [Rhodopila sp.]